MGKLFFPHWEWRSNWGTAMNLKLRIILLCLALIPLATAQKAKATLGEAADSVTRDGKALSAVIHAAVSHPNYTVQEISSAANTVREFIAPSGTVFAIAWNGLVHPDLKVLLGSYDEEYRNALCQQPRTQGQRHLQLKTERLVVETGGHMRNLQGRAYLPSLVPEGVNLNEIR